MPGYHPSTFEKNWQQFWLTHKTFRAANPGQPGADRPKYYVLDMFPYPSGAGLHVGHPLGYIASDIIARYKRHRGFNVLHPMGFDSFGLPAEQYAIQTGQHPEKTTRENIARYIEQLQSLGFSYDWDREVRTSDKDYYRWTQWIFLRLFNSWYDLDADRARPLKELTDAFGAGGSAAVRAAGDAGERAVFTAGQGQLFTEHQRLEIVALYRLAYQTETYVNWCPGLGSVLSNDEVKDGVSERGGYPVERRLMPQWLLRITAYADRLLRGLDALDWPDAVKEMQRNWIGRSEGAEVRFALEHRAPETLTVFTTRPDTLFGVSYLAVAPEFENLEALVTDEYRDAVAQYMAAAKNRSERDRQADVKTVSGQFTGAFALHPFTGARVPVWVADYVLAGYGTGVVMAVPAHDTRDFAFAHHFELPIIPVIEGYDSAKNEAYTDKAGRVVNSGFLDGLDVKYAITAAIAELERTGQGAGRINFRLRDAIFDRQRYWGEPLPIYYAADGTARGIAESDLPLTLPEIDEYKPTQDGNPPLGRATDWKYEK
ncbi:MAG: leucine--tRNA ligase, partial [Hymenobacteraceae bacterium]|nr:leucine--tRNA ligase [Hymenobacteraceae bacterium]